MANHHPSLFFERKITRTLGLVFIISIFLIVGQITIASSQILSDPVNLSFRLELAPAHVESGKNVHSIGYVYLINKQGIPIAPTVDTTIKLESEDTRLASVEDSVTINANESYAIFDVRVVGISG